MEINKSKSILQLDLEQGKGSRNRYFESRWLVNGQEVFYNNGDSKLPDCFKIEVSLPGKIEIELTGRTDNDFKSFNNQILFNKYIEVKSASLSGIPIDQYVLDNLCKFKDVDGNEDCGPYWDKNLNIQINLDCNDPIEWHLKNNKFSHQYRLGWS